MKSATDIIDREKPAYEEAKHRTPIGPIDAVAPAFFAALSNVVAPDAARSEWAPWVTGAMLTTLLGADLDTRTALDQDSLAGGDYSRVLAFDERFVPIVADGELVGVVDQYRIARSIARRALASR